MKKLVLIGAAALMAGGALAQTSSLRTGGSTATITESTPAQGIRTQDTGPVRRDAPAGPVDPLAQDTVMVRNGGSTATLTQSGDPAVGTRRVERWDGHTRIEQRNGSNVSVIVQDKPGTPSPLDADPFFKDGR